MSLSEVYPCTRLARGKFELTNQDSAGGKNVTVLTSMQVNRKGFEIRQLFSQKMVLAFSRKGICNSKYHIRLYKAKNMKTLFGLQASNLAPKWVAGFRPGMATRSSLVEGRKVG